jgi:two-component system phosphate regulon response regulator PhoB
MKNQATLLIVEDEAPVAEMLRRALEDLGHRCLTAENADAASRLIEAHPVDGVTLDLLMPGRPGLDWLEDLAGARPELARNTLVITGSHLDSSLVERLARCGAGVLTKPFTLEALGEAVRSQIARPSNGRVD